MPTHLTRLFAASLLVLGSAGVLNAQKSAAQTADEKELASYRLTMDMVNKMARVNRAIVEEMKKDPKQQALMKANADLKAYEKELEKKDEPTDAETEKLEKLRAEKERLEEATDDKDRSLANAETITDMAANIAKIPGLSAALAREGVAPREFAKFFLAMVQASFAAAAQKQGLLKQLPPEINAENVKFVLDHEAELKKMQEEWQVFSGK
jgi:hypothetical protein